MYFVMLDQIFYSGLRFEDIKKDFLEQSEMFDFLPNDKYLLLENASICGITAKIKITFINDILDSIVITATEDSGGVRKEYHRIILRSLLGEPNAKKNTANVYYDFGELIAGDYITYNRSSYINIQFIGKSSVGAF